MLQEKLTRLLLQETPVKKNIKENTTVILVKPQMPELIGMIARVMLNFNFKNLFIVSPREEQWREKAYPPSCGAFESIFVKEFSNLKDAIAEQNLVIALSARKRYLNKENYDLENLFFKMQENSINYQDSKIAFLFGNEKNGLSNEDISECNFIVNIATNEDFSSLNLAQAVGLVLYKIQNYSMSMLPTNIIENEELENKNQATYKEVDYFIRDLINKLEQRNYFSSLERKSITASNIKDIYFKRYLSKNEIKTLMGIHKILFKE